MTRTLKDIAEAADVSLATVSRVFSGKDYVKEDTRLQILKIADDIGYVPKKQKTRKKCTDFQNTIGFIIPDIANRYYVDVIHGVETITDAQGIELLILNTDEDPKKEIRSLALLNDMQVGGVISVPVSSAVAYNVEYMTEMSKSGVPMVLLDRDLRGSDMDGVFMDNYNGAYQSIKTFIANGHRDIAIICGPTTSTSALSRLNGYFEALKESNIPINEEYVLYGDFKFNCGYDLTTKLIERNKEVTAIFASNSRMSAGCQLALAEKNIKIPDDMAFISCGRIEEYDKSNISCVEYPVSAIGEECAKILIDKMKSTKNTKSTPSRRVTFAMSLILRGSEVYPKNRKVIE